MAVRVVVGAQWGDEGKGKIVDILSAGVDYVIRYQGGANAGHTLKFDDKVVVLHLVPSGIFNGDAVCVIGNGVVIDPMALHRELETVRSMGVDVAGRLLISDAAHVILPYHRVLDKVKEASRGDEAIGTTGRGIGPAYVSKVSRVGIRMGDLMHPAFAKERIRQVLSEINPALVSIYKADPIDPEAMIDEVWPSVEAILPFVANTAHVLHQGLRGGASMLLEGAQGSLLDVDHGTYPFVTSSSPTSGGACTGSGIPPTAITHVMGISKAYCTRVGNGPFPTELLDSTGELLRAKGHEFGATTGRPRRCGWLDMVALGYAAELNGMNEMALTKLDVLDDFDTLRVCELYELDGERIDWFPLRSEDLARVRPVYREFKGWKGRTTRDAARMKDLPAEARRYVDWLEERIRVPFKIVSTGPKRNETILL